MAKSSSTTSDVTKADDAAAAAPDQDSGKLGYKVLTTVGASVGALVARRVLTTGWKAIVGKEPPESPQNPDVHLAEAVSWAAASAAVVAVARVAAQRRLAATWQRASGQRPPA